MLNDDVDKEDGHAKPCGRTGSEMHLPEYTYTYLMADFELEYGSFSDRF